MNIDEAKYFLDRIINNTDQIGICVYASTKHNNEIRLLKLDIKESSKMSLLDMFINSIKETFYSDPETSLIPLSSADDRNNALYIYDMEWPKEFLAIQEVTRSDDIELMNIKDNAISNIKSLAIEIGNNENQIIIYKNISPVNIIGRKSFLLGALQSKTCLEKLEGEMIRISDNFQMIIISNALIITDLKSLERHFGFHEIIKKESQKGLEKIIEMNLISNPETLREAIDDIAFARKLTKVSSASPVLKNNIPNESILAFCKSHKTLSKEIKISDDDNRIILDTKRSKNIFIKLMMDDFLTSELTESHYVSLAKDKVD